MSKYGTSGHLTIHERYRVIERLAERRYLAIDMRTERQVTLTATADGRYEAQEIPLGDADYEQREADTLRLELDPLACLPTQPTHARQAPLSRTARLAASAFDRRIPGVGRSVQRGSNDVMIGRDPNNGRPVRVEVHSAQLARCKTG